MNLPATKAQAYEVALVQGDLSRLSETECISYYNNVCESVGLNPLTKPFEYLFLNGKKILYAKKDATDQLRKLNGISVIKVESKIEDGLLETTVYGQDKTGRVDSEIGVVLVSNLKGLDLANAKMKGLTKAKRRLTLSMSGLGLLDETEVADISREAKVLNFNNDPFEKKAEIAPTPALPTEPIPEDVPEFVEPEFLNEDPGSYEIRFGKKHAGKTLKQMDPFELNNYITWLVSSSKEQGKPLTGNALDLVEYGNAYLKTLEFERDRQAKG